MRLWHLKKSLLHFYNYAFHLACTCKKKFAYLLYLSICLLNINLHSCQCAGVSLRLVLNRSSQSCIFFFYFFCFFLRSFSQWPLAGRIVVRLGVNSQLRHLPGIFQLWAVQHDPSGRPHQPELHRLDQAAQVRLQWLLSVAPHFKEIPGRQLWCVRVSASLCSLNPNATTCHDIKPMSI